MRTFVKHFQTSCSLTVPHPDGALIGLKCCTYSFLGYGIHLAVSRVTALCDVITRRVRDHS